VKPLLWNRVPLRGVQLIEASAGTGKTFTLTTLVLRLLLERELRIDQILVVTFTNAATLELRDRVRKRVREAVLHFEDPSRQVDAQIVELRSQSRDIERDRERLELALRGLDECAIFTIHGFCQRVLAEYAFESGAPFQAELLAEARPLLERVVHDFWARETYEAHPSVIAHYEANKLHLGALRQIANLVLGAPDMRIVLDESEDVADADLARALAEHDAQHARLREALEASLQQVETALLAGSLHKNVYGERSPKLVEALRSHLTGAADPVGAAAAVKKLTPAHLKRKTTKGASTPKHRVFDLAGAFEASALEARSLLERRRQAVLRRFLAWVTSEMDRLKLRAGVQSFDDLLRNVASALQSPRSEELARRLRSRYPVALVDEFQDTDPVQYGMFESVYATPEAERAGAALFMIGDPKQAIYAFRGADVYTYLRAAERASQAAYGLDTNYRSDPALVTALNGIYARQARPFGDANIQYQPVKTPSERGNRIESAEPGHAAFEVLFLRADPRHVTPAKPQLAKRRVSRLVPLLVAEDVRELLSGSHSVEGRPLRPGDIAVLTRKNVEARRIQDALTEAGVDSVLHGDSSVIDTEEALELAWVLRAIVEPTNLSALRVALATRLLGLSGDDIAALDAADQALLDAGDGAVPDAGASAPLQAPSAASVGDHGWDSHVELFAQARELWLTRGFVQSLRMLLRERDVLPRLLGQVAGERILTNTFHLIELLHQAAVEQKLGPAGLIEWFDELRHDPDARDALGREAVQIRLESDEKKLQLTTMHKSKGLEYPVVYCPYLWDGRLLADSAKERLVYHDPSAGHQRVLDLRSEKKEALEIAEEEAMAENLRLAYVALTRAKHRVLAVWGNFHKCDRSSLAWLLHHPAGTPGGPALETMPETELLRQLDELASASAGTVAVRPVDARELTSDVTRLQDEALPRVREAEGSALRSLQARPIRRLLTQRFKTSSFTALTLGHEKLTPLLEEGADRDLESERAGRRAAAASESVLLDAFPRGAGPGTLLHAILEKADFRQEARPLLREQVRTAIERHGLSVEQWCDPLTQALGDVLDTPLDGTGLRLCRLGFEQRRAELEFMLPVGESRRSDLDLLTVKKLAAAFREHAATPRRKQYGRELERLNFAPFAGFLRGFVDLVFEVEGRYYIVDWKSNHLGPLPADYALPLLEAEMAEQHYVLQYHLYTLALHRHFKARVPGYDYETHFGGVFYLFLRGMSPARGPRTGVYFDRPPRGLVEALSRVLRGSAREAKP
jgi:exodeoxyribonuclease V beta subunit